MDRLNGRFAGHQIIGERSSQQDDFDLVDCKDSQDSKSEDTLLILCDGMGGPAGGDVASLLAKQAFGEAYRQTTGSTSDRLKIALRSANEAIAQEKARDRSKESMGTTLIGAAITSRGLDWISVGDSLLWLFRDGRLYRLNADHSGFAGFKLRYPNDEPSAEERASNVIYSAVLGQEPDLIDQKGALALKKTDLLLVASDGLEPTLDVEEITAILKDMAKKPLSEQVDELIRAVEAKAEPGQDNTTVILFRPAANWGQPKSSIPLPPPVSGESVISTPHFLKRQDPLIVTGFALMLAAIASFGGYYVYKNFIQPSNDRDYAESNCKGIEKVGFLPKSKGINVNARDKDGRTPLHYAARQGCDEVVNLLITRGANVNAKNKIGNTPLHLATQLGQGKAARLLIQEGAKVNARDQESRTPLHLAAQLGQGKAARLLIQEGAKVNARDQESRTPLHYAARWGKAKVAALLIKKGADVNALNNEGHTPLQLAEDHRHDKTADIIRQEADRTR